MRKGFRKAYKDSTLFCIEGGSAGRKTGMLDRDVTFGNKLCMFHSKGNVPDKYIYYVLQAPLFKQTFVNSISGIIGEVSIKKLQGIHIPSPPVEEQQRIVDKLDRLLPLCESLEAMV